MTATTRLFQDASVVDDIDYNDCKVIVEGDVKRYTSQFETLSTHGLKRGVALFQANTTWIDNKLGKEADAIINDAMTIDVIESLLLGNDMVLVTGSVVCAGICTATGNIRKSEATFTYRSMWSYSNGEVKVLGNHHAVLTLQSASSFQVYAAH